MVVYREPRHGIYKKLIVRNDTIAGAILLGETEAAGTLMQMFMAGSTVPARRADLFFGTPTGVAAAEGVRSAGQRADLQLQRRQQAANRRGD